MNSTVEIVNRWADHALGFWWPMLWQSSLLIAFLLALDLGLGRKLRPAVLYAVWLTVLVKLLLPPSLALPFGIGWWLRPPEPARAAHRTATLAVTSAKGRAPGLPPQELAALLRPRQAAVSLAAWGLVASSLTSFGFLVWMSVRWRQVIRATRLAVAVPDWLGDLLEETRRAAGVRRPVRLRLINGALSPAVFGLVSPTILLPQALVSQFPARQIRPILLHELMHIRRGDVWVNCVQTLLQVVYWWHPLVWLANARIRRAREEAVDDAVMLTLRSDADTYAPTLLEVAKLVMRRPLASVGLVGILESHGPLRKRIERLIDFRPPRKAGLTLASALSVVAFGALALPMGQAPASQPPEPLPAFVSAPPAFPEPGLGPSESQDARIGELAQAGKPLFGDGELDEAEKTLKEVAAAAPANPIANYYINLIRETRRRLARGNKAAASEPPFGSNPFGRTNVVANNKARQAILAKLMNIRLDRVQFDSRPLGEVIRYLAEETRRRDPAERGVNFIINSGSGNPNQSWPPIEQRAVSTVPIKIIPALVDVRVVDFLDSIVQAAESPIQYSVEDYAVVFAWKSIEPPQIYTRLFKVDASTFSQGLESVVGAFLPPAGKPRTKPELLRGFFETIGVEMKPPRSFFFNESEGTLLVRATLAEFDVIESAVMALHTAPLQLNLKARFLLVPEERAGWMSGLLNFTNQPGAKAANVSILTAPQVSALVRALEQASGVELLNECSVTTLSGRQTEIQAVDLQTVATNINPRALNPPGVSTNSAGGNGLYLEGSMPFGPTLDILPYASTDDYHVQLTATATMSQFLGYYEATNSVQAYVDGTPRSVSLPLPHIKIRQMTAAAIVVDGQSFLLESPTDGPAQASQPTGENKRLLAIITPTIIDAAGNRLHKGNEPPPK